MRVDAVLGGVSVRVSAGVIAVDAHGDRDESVAWRGWSDQGVLSGFLDEPHRVAVYEPSDDHGLRVVEVPAVWSDPSLPGLVWDGLEPGRRV